MAHLTQFSTRAKAIEAGKKKGISGAYKLPNGKFRYGSKQTKTKSKRRKSTKSKP